MTVSVTDYIQVTCEYDYIKGFLTPIRVHTVVISTQHEEDMDLELMRSQLMEHVVKTVIPSKYLDDNTIYHLQVGTRPGGQRCVLERLSTKQTHRDGQTDGQNARV